MGKKRKIPSPSKDKDDNNNIMPSSNPFKRPRPSSHKYNPQEEDDDGYSKPSIGVQPRLDPTYGQRGAFPGLDDAGGQEGQEGEESLFYGPASDGLEYLRMVR